MGAGRTDAGVHAFHQVVHVDLPRVTKVRSLDGERLRESLNKQLRGRVQILVVEPVPMSFTRAFLRRGASTATSSSSTTRPGLIRRTPGPGR